MRTKILLLTAAAVAAGLASSQAQDNVYSVNIVGYINTPTTANQYTLLANQLDNGTNTLNDLLATMPNKSQVQVWNGTSFDIASKGGTPSVWTPNLTIPVGTGFFLKTPTAQTNTFVGSVAVAAGSSVTNSLVANNYVLVGSTIPYGDTLNGTNINLASLPNKSQIQVWNGTSYTISSKGGNPSVWTPDLPLAVGQGFFLKSAAATNWVQSIQ